MNLKKHGRAYRFELRGEKPPLQHAVLECSDCDAEASFVCSQTARKEGIVDRFERMGWEVYRTSARCPKCKHKRTQQKAAFARLGEATKMNGQSGKPFSLVKSEKPNSPENAPTSASTTKDLKPKQTYIVVIDEDGVPSIRQIENAQEMLFGEQSYIVIPS